MVVENEPPTLASTLAEDEIVEVGGTNVNVAEQEISDGDEEGEGEEDEEGDFDSNEETDESTMSSRGGGSSHGRGPGHGRGGGRITVSTTPTNDPASRSETAPPPPISAPASSPAPHRHL
ncbi:hypothetical protein PIB30_075776 [Stylosanthes scabra]|uniref:Uncharacterized protein n=1 Tax=Stylosanthes scabra TaxID=79078 RepID=A0ABU6VRZ5_9FABA|nr:hypothetical protein [Stylosanthes scabra]